MSKYCVSGTCCQNKELNSLSHHSCYLLAPVADYDGSTLMSEMMMLVDGDRRNTDNHGDDEQREDLGGFFKDLYWVVYNGGRFAPISTPTSKRIPYCY